EAPQLLAREHFEEVTAPGGWSYLFPGSPLRMSGYGHLRVRYPAPNLGQHNEYVYKELLGYTDEEYARLEREWNRSGLGTLPRDAVVLVDEPPHTKDDVARWYPLGPSNELWIEVPDDADLDLSYPEGVVDLPSESGKERETLANYLEQRHGKKAVVPQNLRVIVLATPPEFAKLRNLPGRVSRFGIGVVIVGGLVIGSALRRRRS
ncbi:MAG: hypothetical protein HYV09_39835, partial [Deltaproteobacteria bacterium]|nr:hypothetical protein [Deltaproteobacteria bacterium]